MHKYACVAMVPLFFLIFLSPVFCQDDGTKQHYTITGDVVDVDWVASQLTVRYYDARPGRGYDEINFTVSADTKIIKGTDEVSLSDLNKSNQVSVEYVDNASAGLLAVKIVVEI